MFLNSLGVLLILKGSVFITIHDTVMEQALIERRIVRGRMYLFASVCPPHAI
jgi:hypothetical protein